MRKLLKSILFSALILSSQINVHNLALALEKTDQIRIHALDCGSIETKNLGVFSDTGEYDGKLGKLNDACFLIQHPKGLLLWDAGLGDTNLGKPMVYGPFQMSVNVTLSSQLDKLKVKPADVQYLAFSHTHSDHTGNAYQFPQATWLWQEKENEYFLAKKSSGGMNPVTQASAKKAKKEIFSGDHDVFGDGKVMILSTPGHTPGHQNLLVKLESGPVFLSGDLYHLRANREHKRIPVFNTSRAETLASMDRIEKMVKNLNAKLIIQHDPEDFAALPKFPEYLK